MDWGSYSFMGGAQLFVPAREGLTKEWLAAAVQHAVASAHVVSTGDAKALCDLPKVKDVHVGVVSGGNGFWVQLIGRDDRTSDALLKWAREFVELKSSERASR
jgi:phosphoserine phosphatase